MRQLPKTFAQGTACAGHLLGYYQTVWELTEMKVRPLHDRIIVQRLDEGEQKIGGIIIPDTAKEKPQQAR